MEKSYRLILKNLSPSVNDEKITELFTKFGKVEKVDLKEKQDISESNKINRFAFVSINTTDRNLNTCFREVNETLIEGNRLHVEVAKESYLERMKREREEAAREKEANVTDSKFKPNNSKSIEFDNTGYINQHARFKNNIAETNKTKEKHSGTPKKFFDNEESFSSNDNFKNYVQPDYKERKKRKSEFLPLVIPEKKLCENTVKEESQKSFENPKIAESERKRFASLKAKKEAFKAKEQAVRNALKIVDITKQSKKIIFDDLESREDNETPKKMKLCWDSDEEGEEIRFPDGDELNSKAKIKLSKLQSTTGNDKRFILDDRFVENEDIDEELKEEETEVSQERKIQLEILGDVLGKPISTEIKNHDETHKSFKRAKMIRYDPAEENHHQYEIVPQKLEKIRKQKKMETEHVKEAEPLPVSKEVFFSVSDKLTSALADGEQFSVLKMLGKESTDLSTEKSEVPHKYETTEKKSEFNFNANKAFKYDSSDDEEPYAKLSTKGNNFKSECEIDSPKFYGKNDRFLFVVDDHKFKECEEFFSKRSEQSEDLKILRPKLKQTIRKRIRTNTKKNSFLHKRKPKR